MKVCDIFAEENKDLLYLLLSNEDCKSKIERKYDVNKYREIAEILNRETIDKEYAEPYIMQFSDKEYAEPYIMRFLENPANVDYVVALVSAKGTTNEVLDMILHTPLTERVKEAFVFRDTISEKIAEQFVNKVSEGFVSEVMLLRSSPLKHPNETVAKIACNKILDSISYGANVSYSKAAAFRYCCDVHVFEKMAKVPNIPSNIYALALQNPIVLKNEELMNELFESANCTNELLPKLKHFTPEMEKTTIDGIMRTMSSGGLKQLSQSEQYKLITVLHTAIRSSQSESTAIKLAEAACSESDKLKAETDTYIYLAQKSKVQKAIDYIIENSSNKTLVGLAAINPFVEHNEQHRQKVYEILKDTSKAPLLPALTAALIHRYGVPAEMAKSILSQENPDETLLRAILLNKEQDISVIAEQPYASSLCEAYVHFRKNAEKAGCLDVATDIQYAATSYEEVFPLDDKIKEIRVLESVIKESLQESSNKQHKHWLSDMLKEVERLEKEYQEKKTQNLYHAIDLCCDARSEFDFYSTLEYVKQELDTIQSEMPNLSIKQIALPLQMQDEEIR